MKLCKLCLFREAIKNIGKFSFRNTENIENNDYCECCASEINYYFNNHTKDKDEDVALADYKAYNELREKLEDEFLQNGMILADSPLFDDDDIDQLHSQIKRIGSNVLHITEEGLELPQFQFNDSEIKLLLPLLIFMVKNIRFDQTNYYQFNVGNRQCHFSIINNNEFILFKNISIKKNGEKHLKVSSDIQNNGCNCNMCITEKNWKTFLNYYKLNIQWQTNINQGSYTKNVEKFIDLFS